MTEPGECLPGHVVPPDVEVGSSVKAAPEIPAARTSDDPYGKSALNRSSFRGALLGAALAFLFGIVTSFFSNYLTRRDQHVQEAHKCNALASSLLTTTSFARDAAQAAGDSIAPSNNKNRFVLPAIDEILHGHDQSLDIIDPTSRNIILQLEAYYRAIRDDLANSADVSHQGETFSLLPTSPNKGFYEMLLHQIAQEAQAATHSLETSAFCDELAKTAIFWPSIRKHPRAVARN
jgi:hypothetical protein